MSENAFDAAVIGSGLGGLTAAALLAKVGREVCVIERNHSVGGAASAFKKGALTIEPALHQTADPRDPSDPKHAILAELGLLDEIEWIPVSPFYSVRGGPVGDTFDMPVGFDAAHQALSRRFPGSREGAARLLGEMEQIHTGVSHLVKAGEERSLLKLLRAGIELRPLVRHWRASTADILQRYLGDDEAAKCAIGATIGFYADDPRRLAWPFFAIAQGGYLKSGGVFIKGGSRVLSMKLAKVVAKAGGSVLLGREANGIDFDGSGHPAFVRHVDARTKSDEQRLGAKQVLANCAPHALAYMMPPAEKTAIGRAYLGQALSTSLFSAHFGLSVSPAKLGLDRFDLVVLPDWATSLNEISKGARLFRPIRAAGCRNTASPITARSTPRSPETGRRLSRSSATIASTIGRRSRLRKRKTGASAGSTHSRAPSIATTPDFSAAVVERLFLNARSMHNFLNTPGGAVYGFAPLPFERGIWAGVPRSPRTPLPGVYLASSFAESGGFTGAMKSGSDAARMAMKERAR